MGHAELLDKIYGIVLYHVDYEGRSHFIVGTKFGYSGSIILDCDTTKEEIESFILAHPVDSNAGVSTARVKSAMLALAGKIG